MGTKTSISWTKVYRTYTQGEFVLQGPYSRLTGNPEFRSQTGFVSARTQLPIEYNVGWNADL